MYKLFDRLGYGWFGPPVLAIVYGGLAALSLALTRNTSGIATVWLPSGVLLATLMTVPRPRLWLFALAAVAGSMAANLFGGNGVTMAAGFTAANILEALTAALLVRRRGGCRVSFVDPRGLQCFIGATLLAAIVSTTIATASVASPESAFAKSWFATVWIGMLIVTPMLLTMLELARDRADGRSLYRHRDLAGVAGLAAGICCLTFFQNSYPILFMPFVVMTVAVMRCGAAGAIVTMVCVVAIGSLALGNDTGPTQLLHADHMLRIWFFQLYLLMLFGAALPMAALLANRERLRADLAERVRLLAQAQHAAKIGHWRLDERTQSLVWSPEVFRIHGLDPETSLPPALDKAIDAYHPDDRAMVAAVVDDALRNGNAFDFSARLVTPQGEIRHVVSRGARDYSSRDQANGLFGMIQDVTDRIETERILKEAHDTARRAELLAIAAAETDVLTGLANRRKIMQLLDDAVAAADVSHTTLSIALFDIDHFKSVNDRFGHASGDDVLRRVAQTAAAALREGDAVGRYGGEEFVVLLPGADAAIACRIAERVRGCIEDSATDVMPRVTISLGVAMHQPGMTSERMLALADSALYAAKDAGRNQWRVAA